MHQPIHLVSKENFPPLLQEITDPPEQLYMRGVFPDPRSHTFLTVVGSRKFTPYGKQACEKLLSGLRGYPIIIVSGLALGMDAIAHRAALESELLTIAVPGSGLDPSVLYPSTNRGLAETILQKGGALLSEFPNVFHATPYAFPQRNRIMAGLSHAVLVIEAEERSGTLITSRLATEYNRDVFTVPGSIFSSTSRGPHMLLRLGATPITTSAELLLALGFSVQEKTSDEIYSPEENSILQILSFPKTRDDLICELALPVQQVNSILTVMELKGLVTEQGGMLRKV
ncbi:MAG: DNA processing protein [Parcubacteria group bacterium Gr01-1014_48]|nr:MAG: DNA processing protein [Parcubacteria group bacterium Greene0416_14]TSC74541.1 MAG: DNA processing protein [Parcubacteria group bacterium Gr01-1014_48]TSD01417.1 MAG: DNA processing protein [Parcubacteria group bacterium Greene1014_15]TSD08441.1 MAG: DNA processing protein [Parcubacteria group bacterium Greene0714_4]